MIKNEYNSYYIAAQTGMGKTLAYLLPTVNEVKKNK